MKKLLFLILATLCIIHCGGEADYYPLAVGNVWTYKSTLEPQGTTGEETIEITRQITVHGQETWERVCTRRDNDTIMGIDTSYFAEVGDCILGYWGLDDTIPDTFLVFPLEGGKSWSSENYIAAVESGDSVIVPAGVYEECWLIEYAYPYEACAYVYLAPDVGMVKKLSTGGYSTYILELESAELK
ncbi:MAG: hypothetical protein WBB37_09480 [bacterium]